LMSDQSTNKRGWLVCVFFGLGWSILAWGVYWWKEHTGG
jgi:hypothetical protein